MDLDIGGLWSWTLPLWGLFVLVFFLGGVITSPISISGLGPPAPASHRGGGLGLKGRNNK
jgi:hypothetical protein